MATDCLLGLDLSYQPGDGKIKVDTGAGDTDTTGEDVEVTAGDTRGISIMPMIAISDSSALYFKYGVTHVDLTGNNEMTAGIASSMLADTWQLDQEQYSMIICTYRLSLELVISTQ